MKKYCPQFLNALAHIKHDVNYLMKHLLDVVVWYCLLHNVLQNGDYDGMNPLHLGQNEDVAHWMQHHDVEEHICSLCHIQLFTIWLDEARMAIQQFTTTIFMEFNRYVQI